MLIEGGRIEGGGRWSEVRKPDYPLLKNPHVTISPYNAGLTEECAMHISVAAVQNIMCFFDGKREPKFIIN
jgi:D-3-phosphoglycerate dehydrogenase